MEERRPVPETWYLSFELVAVVIVGVDTVLVRFLKPVDESVFSEGKSARQDASFSPNTDRRICEETPRTLRLQGHRAPPSDG